MKRVVKQDVRRDRWGRPKIRTISSHLDIKRKVAMMMRGQGMSGPDICRQLGLARSTFEKWMYVDEEFRDGVQAYQKQICDQVLDKFRESGPKVADAVVQAAIGGDMTAAKMVLSRIGLPEVVQAEMHIPTDRAAALALVVDLSRRLSEVRSRLEQGSKKEDKGDGH